MLELTQQAMQRDGIRMGATWVCTHSCMRSGQASLTHAAVSCQGCIEVERQYKLFKLVVWANIMLGATGTHGMSRTSLHLPFVRPHACHTSFSLSIPHQFSHFVGQQETGTLP